MCEREKEKVCVDIVALELQTAGMLFKYYMILHVSLRRPPAFKLSWKLKLSNLLVLHCFFNLTQFIFLVCYISEAKYYSFYSTVFI